MSNIPRKMLAACFFSFTLIAIGCGKSHAQSTNVPMSAVMEAIHQYGTGHSALAGSDKPLDFASTPKNELPEIVFDPHMKSLLLQEKFADLESIAAKARSEKTRHTGGFWVIDDFYEAVSSPLTPYPTATEWNDHIALVNKWVVAYPESVTARIALANAYYNRGWAARGQGYANTVKDSAWDTFGENINRSKLTLLEAAKLKDKDLIWYEAMQRIARSEGWDKAQARELFEQGSAFAPDYYLYYREYAMFLLPKWYGEEGETQAFADESQKRLTEPMASMVYFEIASVVSCQCDRERDSLSGTSWPKIREGYSNIVHLYGASNLKMNRFAYMSYVANDKSSARDVFSQIGDEWNHNVWSNQLNFENARAWALAL